MRVKELAAWLGARFEGDGECELCRVAPIEEAGADELSFVTRGANRGKGARLAADSRAGCLLVPLDFPMDLTAAGGASQTIIRVADPRAAVAQAIAKLHPRVDPPPGVHPTAVVGTGAVIDPGAYIGALVTIGAGARIGAGTQVHAGSVIGDGVHIGAGCLLHPRVTIYSGVTVGDSVILHSGCVIGADGFGFVFQKTPQGGGYHKFPQVGRVEIADRVEIGANSCVDRAALGVTSIGEGTKLDNLVHIAHNCRIGRHVVIAAQTGLSGGVVVEDYAVIGGQVGIGDKARIESRAVLGSGCGVLTSKIVRSGQVVWGTPARPLKEYLRQLAVLSSLAKKRRGMRSDQDAGTGLEPRAGG